LKTAEPASVPTDRAAEGARLSLKNAQMLFDFAAAGAKKTRGYGPAISLLVLSAEEGAKAMALWFEAISLEPTGVSIAHVLSRHQTKHTLAQGTSALAHLFGLLHQIRDEVQSEVDSGAVDVSKAGSRWAQRVTGELQRQTQQALVNEPRFVTWYKDANRLKNAGLYVDWSNGTWHDPGVATEKEFDEYRSYVEWWLGVVTAMLAVPVDELQAKLVEARR
jgi:AbiV family abortive infection protein